MTDWMAPVRAMQHHREQKAIVRAYAEANGIEFLKEEKYVGPNILEWDNGGLRWNGKPVTVFIEFPAQPSDPVLMGLVVVSQDDGNFTVTRVTRRQTTEPWVGYTFVSDLSWQDVRRWINEDTDI